MAITLCASSLNSFQRLNSTRRESIFLYMVNSQKAGNSSLSVAWQRAAQEIERKISLINSLLLISPKTSPFSLPKCNKQIEKAVTNRYQVRFSAAGKREEDEEEEKDDEKERKSVVRYLKYRFLWPGWPRSKRAILLRKLVCLNCHCHWQERE